VVPTEFHAAAGMCGNAAKLGKYVVRGQGIEMLTNSMRSAVNFSSFVAANAALTGISATDR